MRFITAAAINKRSVTVLAVIILLIGGVFTYNSLQVELFPNISFPLVTVSAAYPSAGPDAVAREVTAPVERAISGLDGLESVQSTSFEGNSVVLATFAYGTDMANAQSDIETALNAIDFPAGVEDPEVGRFAPDQIAVIQFSVISDRRPAELQQIVDSQVLPVISGLDGVAQVQVTGEVERQALIEADPARLLANGVSLAQLTAALQENNLTVPGGLIFNQGQAAPVKITHSLDSVEEIRRLVVGTSPDGPVRLSEVARVTLSEGEPSSIYRTNGKPGIGVFVLKGADDNTIEVTEAVRAALDGLTGLPADVEIVVVTDQGPEIQQQIDTLLREALFGFLFAVAVVFAFMLTIRPTVIRGFFTTLRPTLVIALSIPLSVLTGVLLMAWQDMTLNFMTLGGLAISVGRVVDDAIVVLENVYRHIQSGRERWRAALDATTEVGPAILASTLTTIVVFIPLAFIQGLVGAFFLPFALTVCFALVASLVVALTAVPVLGAYLLRPGDLPEGAGDENETFVHETWMQRAYTPILHWTLRHKAITLGGAAAVTAASLLLLLVIPVTLFPSGNNRLLQIDLTMPPGTPAERTLAEVINIENRIAGVSDIYSAAVGVTDLDSGGIPAGPNQAGLLATLADDAPDDLAEALRAELNDRPGLGARVSEISDGPPEGGVEISISGPNYADIAAVSGRLMAALAEIDGIVNLESNVAEAREEVSVEVDPERAAAIGLSTRQVGQQLSRYLIGQTVTTINIDGAETDVVLAGAPEAVGSLAQVRALTITGPGGSAPLGELAQVTLREGPVRISRTDGQRSASITGFITTDDTQAVGAAIDARIAALELPPGVAVNSGGIFDDIAEGFQAIFLSMIIGIVLMYLVMVASLGSLRNPVVIISSLPLALIGVLLALALTGRTLGLPAMMGLLLLIGIVVTNAIVLIAFVEQLRARGMPVYEALITGGRVRLRPILMTALTTSFALLPLAAFPGEAGGIISSELATVVIGGLISSTALTLIVVPIVYTLFNESIPALFRRGHPVPTGRTPTPESRPAPAD